MDDCQKCGYPLAGGECDNECENPAIPLDPSDVAVARAIEFVNATEWPGDILVRLIEAIDAGRVLAERITELDPRFEQESD